MLAFVIKTLTIKNKENYQKIKNTITLNNENALLLKIKENLTMKN